jgi:hypothetical protein
LHPLASSLPSLIIGETARRRDIDPTDATNWDAMASIIRLAVVAAVVLLLVRAGTGAWRNRALALAVWRRIRLRHIFGSVGLLAVVLTVALALLELVPVTEAGFGKALGLSGNAVFAPLEEASLRANGESALAPGTPAAAADRAGPSVDMALVAGTSAFFGLLLLLFPWLAYVEERTFREGLEHAGPVREVLSALRFGLVHLIMLIPVAAALAVGVAGFFYGRVYRRAYRRAERRTEEVAGPFGMPVAVAPSTAQLRGEAVLASTVWHTTFNSVIVVLVWVSLMVTWFGV